MILRLRPAFILAGLLAALTLLPRPASAQSVTLQCATMSPTVAGCAKVDGTTLDVVGGVASVIAVTPSIVGASVAAPHVATETALAASSTATYPNGVWRDDYAAGNGAPPLFYRGESGTCGAHNLANDGGLCVNDAAGNSFVAVFPSGDGVDAREFGYVVGADNTAVAETIDASMGQSGWPASLAKTIILPAGVTIFNDVTLLFATGLRGAGDYGATLINGGAQIAGGTVVEASPSMTTSGQVLLYQGAGPFVLSDVAFACPTYAATGTFAEPAHCGNDEVEIEPASATTQVTEVRTNHVRFIGGNNGIVIVQTQQVDLEIDEVDTPYGFGAIVTDGNNGSGVFTGRVRVHMKRCINSGQYCVSMPADVPPASIMLAARDLDVKIDACTGAGLLVGENKACLDMTSEAGDQMRFDVTAMNSYIGVETKLTDGNFGNTTPQKFRDRYGKLVQFQNIDTNNCLQIPHEANTTVGPDTAPNSTFDVTCDWSPPNAWQANLYEPEGYVFTANGNTYYTVQAGVSGTVAPVGTTPYAGIADGSAIVSYIQATPSASAVTVGASIEANSYLDVNVHAHGIAYGYQIDPRGSTDATLRYATLRLSGTVARSCLRDVYVAIAGETNLTADHVTFSGWNCNNLSTSQEDLSIGNGSGGNHVNWTNLAIVGSNIEGGKYGFRNQGGSIAGTIVGSRIVASNAAFYIQGPTALTVTGGMIGTSGGAGQTQGVIAGEAGSSGTITLIGVTSANSDSSSFGTFNPAAGSLSVIGQALNAPSATQPTTKCSAGIDFAPGTVPATAYLWGCSAANTWAKAY